MNEPQDQFSAYSSNQAVPSYPARRFPWGCLLGGCAGVFLLMLGGLALTAFLGVRFYNTQITKYTSETPVELPTVEISPERMAEIEKRVEEFQEKLEKGEAAEPLVLTEEDVNALISREDQFRGRVYVTIEGDQVSAEVSVPTDMLPGAKGRFFNGEVVLDGSLENGVLIVKADQASVNGEPVPEEYMQGIRKENLAKDAYKDPDSAAWLRKFESMRVVDNTIVLTPAKPDPKDAASDTDSVGEAESVLPLDEGADAESDSALEVPSEADTSDADENAHADSKAAAAELPV